MDKEKRSKTKYIHDLAKSICERYNIHYYKDRIFWQNGLSFSTNKKALFRDISITNKISVNYWNDIKVLLSNYAKWVDNDIEFHIRLNNGIIKEGKFVDERNDSFTIFNLPISYNPDAYDEHVDKFLNFVSCDDRDLRNVLEEMVGHVLMTKEFPHAFFFLIGEGRNGKSTFIEMLKEFAGHLTSCIDFEDLNSLTFVHELIGKLVNICDDADNLHLERAKNLKSMSSGNSITAKALYEAPITMVNSATMIFTSNDPPSFKDKSFGLVRRLQVLPFEAKVKEVEFGLLKKLTSQNAKEYLLKLGLEGIERIFANKMQISEAECIKKATAKYHLENDSVASWEQENPICVDTEVRVAYREYHSWCLEGGMRSVGISHFARRLNKRGYESFEQWSPEYKKSVTFIKPLDSRGANSEQNFAKGST